MCCISCALADCWTPACCFEEGLPVTAIGVQAGTIVRIERKALLRSLHNEGALGLA